MKRHLVGSEMLYTPSPDEGKPAPLQGEAHPEDTTKAVDAIRDLLEQEQTKPPRAAPQPASPSTALAVSSEPEPSKTSKVSGRRKRAAKSGTASRFQPSWRMSAAILVLASTLWKPWLLPGLAVGLVVLSVIIYRALGAERVAGWIAGWHARVEARNPARAAAHRARANRLSARLERGAGYLPDRWTQGLYFPTFEAQRDAEDAARDPFARLVPQERL